MNEALDKLGRPITKGCYIIYGTLLGRSAALRIGRVCNVRWIGKDADKYRYHEHWSITVHGLDDSWNFRPAKANERRGTLLFPERTVVIDPSFIPEKALSMLQEATKDIDETLNVGS